MIPGMVNPLSISVIVPTLNAAQLLPAHLTSMQPWLDRVHEVIVVDSHSEDASVEIIRSQLKHPNLRILQHPRGLYQSWNHGIQQATAKYVYMSTVGDAICADGLRQLHDMSEHLACDIAISKPHFIREDGSAAGETLWPIDDIIATLNVRHPVRLEGLTLVLFTAVNITGAILGSSASNLYRTQVFQRRPFPTNFGTVGDGAWGVTNMFDYKLGVTAARFSTFREHPKAYAKSVYAIEDLNWKLFQLLTEVWEKRLIIDPALRIMADRTSCGEVLSLVQDHLEWNRRLETERARRIPWILNPSAWRARRQRARQHLAMHERKRAALKSLGIS